MDYLIYVLTTFLGLEHGSCVAVYGGTESSRSSSKKYRNLCYKGLTGLEQHEGEELMTEFSGLGEPVLGVPVAQW